MSKKGLILTVILVVLGFVNAYAQQSQTTGTDSAYSPYSMYGLGDLLPGGTAYTNTMGGVGIATRNKRFLNYTNPASISCRDSLSFMMEFGVEQANRYYYQGINGGMKSVNNTFNISNIAFSFPIYRTFTMMVGFAPYSSIGYDFTSKEGSKDYIPSAGLINRSMEGHGTINNVFVDLAVTFFKRVSIGAEFDFLFGTLNRTSEVAFTNTSYSALSMGYTSVVRAFRPKVGIQYEARLNQENSLIFGATYAHPSITGGSTEDFKYTVAQTVEYYDTLSLNTLTHEKLKTVMEVGAGVAYKFGDKLAVEVNYIYQDGRKTGFDTFQPFQIVGPMTFTGSAAHSIRAGFDYVPNRNDIRYYYKRISYKGGLYYNQSPYRVNNCPVQSYGITFGVTLPVVRWFNGLTLGMDVGRTSTAAPNSVATTYFKFNVGINIHDYWFHKTQYN